MTMAAAAACLAGPAAAWLEAEGVDVAALSSARVSSRFLRLSRACPQEAAEVADNLAEELGVEVSVDSRAQPLTFLRLPASTPVGVGVPWVMGMDIASGAAVASLGVAPGTCPPCY